MNVFHKGLKPKNTNTNVNERKSCKNCNDEEVYGTIITAAKEGYVFSLVSLFVGLSARFTEKLLA